ncbi:hypothetical protein EYF80_048986 [Liparis tanakae]|uniref:Uncharacterized protein n=1 Tax=Liparis tanakae TaxID=230148 RepID=A0A4Z2FKP1_9TELE|nr:hypothetical protein EYF80_048986 [Liparis tanakae]
MTKASRTASTAQNSLEISYGVSDHGGCDAGSELFVHIATSLAPKHSPSPRGSRPAAPPSGWNVLNTDTKQFGLKGEALEAVGAVGVQTRTRLSDRFTLPSDQPLLSRFRALPCSSFRKRSTRRIFSLWIWRLMSLGMSGISQSTMSLMSITTFCRGTHAGGLCRGAVFWVVGVRDLTRPRSSPNTVSHRATAPYTSSRMRMTTRLMMAAVVFTVSWAWLRVTGLELMYRAALVEIR